MELLATALNSGLFKVDEKVAFLGKTVFVSPMLNVVPEDGVMNYVTVENASDYCDVANGAVVMFREEQEQWLDAIVKYSDFFDISVHVLHGIPGLEYADWFESKTVLLPKTAYSAYISEVRMAGEVALQTKESNETRHDRERKQFTRDDGSVRFADHSVYEDDVSELDE